MIESRFPDPRTAGEDGLLCVGGSLDVNTLVDAYEHGIFPWPQEDLPLLWFSPAKRGVLDFTDVHWPKRFLRELRDDSVQITFNKAFGQVIRECRSIPRRHEQGTWILPAMEKAYNRLHEVGYAHSVEAWRGDRLVGGLYGVFVKGVFSGESMFHHENGASKRCLHRLVERLRESGLEWIDIQMVTPILKTFGGRYVSREEFLLRLDRAHANPVQLRLR